VCVGASIRHSCPPGCPASMPVWLGACMPVWLWSCRLPPAHTGTKTWRRAALHQELQVLQPSGVHSGHAAWHSGHAAWHSGHAAWHSGHTACQSLSDGMPIAVSTVIDAAGECGCVVVVIHTRVHAHRVPQREVSWLCEADGGGDGPGCLPCSFAAGYTAGPLLSS